MPRRPKPVAEQLRSAIAQAERKGMTRYAMAQQTGLSESHVGKIAKGETEPKLSTAEKIAEAVGAKLRLDLKR